MFESLVNSVRCKTYRYTINEREGFESLVNSVKCKTAIIAARIIYQFESLVNLFIANVYGGMIARFRHIFPFAT